MTTLAVVSDATAAASRRHEPQPDEWTVSGQPLRDPALRRQILSTLNQISDLPGFDADFTAIDVHDFPSVRSALERGHEHLGHLVKHATTQRRGRSMLGDLMDLLLETEHLRLDVLQAQQEQHSSRFADVQAAFARLRGVGTVAQIMERGPAELCRCGFDRAILSRVQDSVWYVETCHIDGDPEWAKEVVRTGRESTQHLDHMLLESEMMRRRAPVLVSDAQRDPRTHGSVVAAALSRSYVAAPIMPEARVIGFLHADCYQSRRDVDEDDCSVLWLFAEGFGYAFQRTVLLERMRALRDDVQQMTRSISSVAEDICGAETQLAPVDRGTATNCSVHGGAFIEPQSRIESLLSRREIEVLQLMAMGQTNGEIATHLTISEGTVKSHVKHILRKTRAANRAEAVFRFMRISNAGAPGAAPGSAEDQLNAT